LVPIQCAVEPRVSALVRAVLRKPFDLADLAPMLASAIK
jgi:hypothetical protein